MTDTTPVLAPTDHPAKWSQPVLDLLAEYVEAEADRTNARQALRVLDPFAGVGRMRLAVALAENTSVTVTGVELQPEWGDEHTVQGDATDLPAEWGRRFDVIATSPCYGNRMADHHDAADPCKACDGTGLDAPPDAQFEPGDGPRTCRTCKGQGLSWRNTYAHALRRQGGELARGSAAGMQWGYQYRQTHEVAIMEMLRCTVEGGLVLVNMSNHVRDGAEQPVVEWWLNQFLHRACTVVEVRRVRTRRQRHGANGEARVDGEVVIAMRTPAEARLL